MIKKINNKTYLLEPDDFIAYISEKLQTMYPECNVTIYDKENIVLLVKFKPETDSKILNDFEANFYKTNVNFENAFGIYTRKELLLQFPESPIPYFLSLEETKKLISDLCLKEGLPENLNLIVCNKKKIQIFID